MCSNKKCKTLSCTSLVASQCVNICFWHFLLIKMAEMNLWWMCACWGWRSRWEVKGLRGDELWVFSELVRYIRTGSMSWGGWYKNSETHNYCKCTLLTAASVVTVSADHRSMFFFLHLLNLDLSLKNKLSWTSCRVTLTAAEDGRNHQTHRATTINSPTGYS